MSFSLPGSATEALMDLERWWVPCCMYDDIQAKPASGAFFLPASGPVFGPGMELSAVYIFEHDEHAHEFLDAFREAYPDAPVLWDHMKIAGVTPRQVFMSILKHGLVPVQVRREWAPAMFKIYREGHVKSQGRHGPAFQFAVEKALEDAARIARRRRIDWRPV